MSTAALNALYARVAPVPAPVVSLVEMDRRRDGEDFPTIPVQGLELSVGEVSAALFETATEELAVPVPSTDTLYDALSSAVRALGPAGIAKEVGTFAELDAEEFFEVATCRAFAYRLALSFWYEGARSRPMTVGEAAVALYLSDAYRHHQVDALTVRRAPLLVSRAIRQGAAAVPVETLVRLGEAMTREFATHGLACVTSGVTAESHPAGSVVTSGRDWLYRQALPDWHRRRFCFDLMRADALQPSPLIVRLDGGGYVLGATPPAGPDGTWARTLRAEW
ncbi:hypothetical protein [Streptomyces misionensis]|uniref:hypothetical protein n=1 Tax=Streptomyces misionensis TaxID=67331 RepID=UPI0021BD89BD|nr:hypothetical protein [Streptomyces misionensis]